MDTLAAIRRPVGLWLMPAGLLLKALFEISYVYHIAPFWDYSGLILSLNHQKLVESYVIVLIVLLLVSWCERAPSVIILVVGLFNGIIPLASIYALQDRPIIFLIFTVLSFLFILAMTTLPRIQISYMAIAPENFLAICFVALAAVIGLMISQRAYRHFTLDLYAVYDFRHELSELVFVGPFKYLADWAHSVFNIALLLWGLYFIDCIAIGRVPVEIAVGMVIVPATLVMTDADLLTGLLTHGGIAATLMLWLWAGIMTEEARVRQHGLGVPARASGSS
jgi:hypothetical protein